MQPQLSMLHCAHGAWAGLVGLGGSAAAVGVRNLRWGVCTLEHGNYGIPVVYK
jgi:hypothetical protein